MKKDYNHKVGEPCEVTNLAVKHFGEDFGMYLLWNETCFPFDDNIAMDQLQYLIGLDGKGETVVLDGWREWFLKKESKQG